MVNGWPSHPNELKGGSIDAVQSAEIAAVSNTPSPPIIHKASRRVRLASIRDIKKELASIYRLAKSGQIGTQTATRLAYLLDLMARLVERGDIEDRIAALEAARGSGK